jgi:hypothetical protein
MPVNSLPDSPESANLELARLQEYVTSLRRLNVEMTVHADRVTVGRAPHFVSHPVNDEVWGWLLEIYIKALDLFAAEWLTDDARPVDGVR